MKLPNPIHIDNIRMAHEHLKGKVLRTPLIRFDFEDSPAEIYLKPENLQSIGSFKLRGACNAMAMAAKELLSRGVYTVSAGNMAQGVAWNARRLGISCKVIVPNTAPQKKLDSINRLGADYIKLPFDKWWQVVIDHKYEGIDGLFIHPVSDAHVMAGNGTIGLEILEDLPNVDAVIVPFGGGGLSSGIASAIKVLKPDTKVFASEVATACPFSASLAANKPTELVRHTPSFVDGIGNKGILSEMWPLVHSLLDDSIVVSLEQIAEAVRLLMQRSQMIVEGAGASSLAACLTGLAGKGRVVCVISGGNIDTDKLKQIMDNKIPAT